MLQIDQLVGFEMDLQWGYDCDLFITTIVFGLENHFLFDRVQKTLLVKQVSSPITSKANCRAAVGYNWGTELTRWASRSTWTALLTIEGVLAEHASATSMAPRSGTQSDRTSAALRRTCGRFYHCEWCNVLRKKISKGEMQSNIVK